MPEYTAAAVAAVLVVVTLEAAIVRSGVLRTRAYWLTLLIVLGFQVPVDGWLTKRSAPIVLYRRSATIGVRPVWDIPIEDVLFGFALATLVLSLWARQGER
jgi:lycopene cyclase domain-containing protein